MNTTVLNRIPQPRTPGTATPASRFEQGRGETSTIHAVRKTLQGEQAVCDAQPIATFVSGRFDATAAEACAACTVAIVVTR